MENESLELILTESGNPFKTHAAAQSAMAHKKISGDTHHVVSVEGGFAIQRFEGAIPDPTSENIPLRKPSPAKPVRQKTYQSIFDTRDEILRFLDKQEIGNGFRQSIKTVPLQTEEGGFRLELPKWQFLTEYDAKEFMRINQMPEKMVKVVPMGGGGYRIVERYWWVSFNASSDPNDTHDVQLVVQGEDLTIQREKKVVIPERFLECADHTRRQHTIQEPGQRRKTIIWVHTYPYQRFEESTEEEFITQRTTGTKKVKSDIARYGFDVTPEMTEDIPGADEETEQAYG